MPCIRSDLTYIVTIEHAQTQINYSVSIVHADGADSDTRGPERRPVCEPQAEPASVNHLDSLT